jgi:Bifunctional DNA primase/polymerase, N-terminal
MSETALGNALAFARRGFGIVSLHWPIEHGGRLICSCRRRRAECTSPAKHPFAQFVPRGLLDATTDTAKIRDWFTRAPNANYGVITNGPLFVLDVDPKRDGDESLAALERAHGPLPHTWRTITGSGGEHILFNAEGLYLRRFAYNPQAANLNQPLGIGIDAPNYIVGAGSRHILGRRYEWSVDHHPSETEIERPPRWLIEQLATDAAGNPGHDPAEWAKAKALKITDYRDLAVAQVAGKLLRAVSLDPAFVRTLVHDWNACHCAPPLPEREVNRIVSRIAIREAERLEREHARA